MPLNLQERPIFMIGAERSGTTLVMALLGCHSRIAVPEVVWYYPRFYPYLHTYGDLSVEANFRTLAQEMVFGLKTPFWGMKVNPRTIVDEVIELAPERSFAGLYAGMHLRFAQYVNKPRWGEKTPHNLYFVGPMHHDFPNAQFIYITRDGRDAQPAQKPLFDRRDDGAAGLLQGVGGGKAEDVLRVACLEHLPAEGQTQFGLAQVGQHVPRSGDLCGSGSTGRTGDPEGADERQVQHDVHHAGGDYGPERCFRVSAAHDALFGQVIEHQKGQADQIHPPIEHRLSQDLLRRPDEPEQSGQGEKAQCGQAQRQHKIDEQQVVEQFGHLLPGGRGPARCHQQAAAKLHAAGDEQKEHQDGGSIGDRRQRVGIQPQTDDHGIGHRIELGGHHAQDDGQGVPQQRRTHRPMQQGIFGRIREEHLLSENYNEHSVRCFTKEVKKSQGNENRIHLNHCIDEKFPLDFTRIKCIMQSNR